MANKRYDQFSAGTYDPTKILLQADPATGALTKIELSDFNLQQAITNNNILSAVVSIINEFNLIKMTSGDITEAGALGQLLIEDSTSKLRAKDGSDNTETNLQVNHNFIGLTQDTAGTIIDFFIANGLISITDGSSTIFEFSRAGKLGLGKNVHTSPSTAATLFIKAGSATAGTAPIKLTSGTLLTTPENGAIEYNGTDFFATNGSGRQQLTNQPGKLFGVQDDIATNNRFINFDGFGLDMDVMDHFTAFATRAAGAQFCTISINVDSSDPPRVFLDANDDAVGKYQRISVTPQSINFFLSGIGNYASNAAAITAGLSNGDVYRNGDNLCIVHP